MDEIKLRPMSQKGYIIGARTAERFQKLIEDGPGPPSYQPIISEKKEIKLALKPFQCGDSRFPKIKRETIPGPGTYDHNIPCNKKIQFYCSFGGLQTLRTSVQLICNYGLKDKCSSCLKEIIGDYYKNNKHKSLCRLCYNNFKNNLPEKKQKRLSQYYKVRDCSNVHYHETTNSKLQLKSEKDIKKIQLREAYLSLYYD
ncbi:uncharacterized protein LOC100214475 isoform X2 [Hydra vulgaris]|uniref:Uncharacterized protein LOC100214475 isoform X2 n=1 Tax=Hydra vulgaris TaxID=6087 RepID=A0ABM4BI63_HYDVU